MAGTALITGASSGIGAALARLHAAKGGNLVLVARTRPALQALKEELEREHGIAALVLAADLSDPATPGIIFATTEEQGIEIEILMNNAGFGGHGKFHQRDLARDQQMMQVNMTALVTLTHLYLQGMVARGAGRILHTSSTAGFMPGPWQAVYYATKAFVNSFSQAVAQELRGTNVTSTALCPGAVATGFNEASDLQGVKFLAHGASAASVARCGYEAMMKGDLIAFNEKSLALQINWLVPFMPRRMLLKMSEKLMQKQS